MNLVIVTGLSGAGKSQAANALEDMGYYCVDNIPPAIIPAFVDLSKRESEGLSKLAVVTDIRGGNMFAEIEKVLDDLKKSGIDYKILFLDASDDVLIRRYKENRRKHPLCDMENVSLSDAVRLERKRLSKIHAAADFDIDTSLISSAQLKSILTDTFLKSAESGLRILCTSFGFKYGIDVDSDLVFDVRCLPNPFYVDELKEKTGLDKAVSDYVMDSPESEEFLARITAFADFSIPLYIKEGKSQLVISFGCTGGKHRSVTFAELLCRHLKEKGYNASVIHRDINKTQV
ncbi:MAG: RNase adapter RapZ [Clostridia bacterium]|nr:RNase adapter RapZ [Clostridia bacterium]